MGPAKEDLSSPASMRSRQGSASCTLVCLFATVGAVAGGGCLESDLPSVVSQGSTDATTQAPPPIRSSFGDGQVTLEPTDASIATESGKIALTVGLPIDTSTGQVASVGSLTVRLWSDGHAPRSLTLQFSQSSGQINLALENIAAGGPYTLDVIATVNGDVACGGSSPPFFVSAQQTVRVLESVICDADAGLASTLYPGPPL